MNSINQKKIATLIEDTDLRLEKEGQQPFHYLDLLSSQVRLIEKKIGDLKANFPFRKKILEEHQSVWKKLEDRHNNIAFPGSPEGYTTVICWYLAWQADQNSKNFRLLLISEEEEKISVHNDSDQYIVVDFGSKLLSTKPLIEIDLATRAKFGQYLKGFIAAFTEHLSIQRSNISFEIHNNIINYH